MILLQHGEPLAGSDDHVSFCGFQIAGENLQKGRFSGAVCTDEAIAVALGEFDVYILE